MQDTRTGRLWDIVAAALAVPFMVSLALTPTGDDPAGLSAILLAQIAAGVTLAAIALLLIFRSGTSRSLRVTVAVLAAVGAAAPLFALRAGGPGSASLPLWLYMAGYTVLLWRCLALLAAADMPRLVSRGLVAAVFGVALLWYWQVIVVGFDIPHALLPPPSGIGDALAAQTRLLWNDFRVTFFLSVLPGFAIGSLAGFLFALVIDGRPFLARGLLPLGSAFSAIPIVAVAPIMIMWFGSGAESKAAVVVLMTFFPMMVNTLGGLNTVDRMELDLMYSYGAGYWTRLAKLRLPTALPFIFNALKINATLAMIGAIVSEFFGSPLAGMGFRISAMIGRLNLEMVWATIAVAAVAGSLFYGIWAVLERVFTFWHPAQRR
ncbi:MAG: ABC transporter permease [Alphaproteobacteria bacterium]